MTLTQLGHPAEPLSARFFDGDTPGLPLDQLTLRVADVRLADVGSGAFLHYPPRLDQT